MDWTLFAIVGPSQGGKSTIISEMIQRLSTKVGILKTITWAEPRGPEDYENYRFLTPDQYREVETSGRLIQSVQYAERPPYGNDRADVEALFQRGLHGIAALTGDGVINFRNRGYTVEMIRIMPVGPFKSRSAERARIDELRSLTGPKPNLRVVNDFASPSGLAEACAKVEGFILGRCGDLPPSQ